MRKMIKRKKKRPVPDPTERPNMALVKYEHNRDLVPVNPISTKAPKPSRKISKHLQMLNTPMSAQTFIMSHLTLLIISLLFLGGLYFVLNKDNYSTRMLSDYNTPVTNRPASFSLELKNPDDELLTSSKSLVISGKTGPKAAIVVTVDGVSAVYTGTEADINGDFQLTVTLASGLNQLEINAFDLGGNRKSITRTVYFSEEQL